MQFHQKRQITTLQMFYDPTDEPEKLCAVSDPSAVAMRKHPPVQQFYFGELKARWVY